MNVTIHAFATDNLGYTSCGQRILGSKGQAEGADLQATGKYRDVTCVRCNDALDRAGLRLAQHDRD